MKFSIITVCFNSAETIQKTIESVLSQTHSNIEYIIVDGGSKDETVDIIRQFTRLFDGRMNWISEPDKGLYDAMNKGIKLATGDYIAILNSDDTFYGIKVIEELSKFHINNNNKIDASIGNVVQYNKKGRIIRKYNAKNWEPNKLKIGFMPPHPAVIFKRELFEKLGFYQLDFIIGADYELVTRFFLKNNISWKYSGIITTAMLIGGLSTSGVASYKIISKEIKKALNRNQIKFSNTKVKLRGLWKIIAFMRI